MRAGPAGPAGQARAGVTLVVAPEPAAWVAPVCRHFAAQGAVRLLAPWSVPPALAWVVSVVARVPPGRRFAAAWARRMAPAEAVGVGGAAALAGGLWLPAQAALRGWAGDLTDRQVQARFWLRAALDGVAARMVAAAALDAGAEVVRVVAPSLGARATFAAALARGAQTWLVQDLPLLRRLNLDLDAAAARWPECRFLRRHRAARTLCVRQEAEWVLAEHIGAQGSYAAAGLAAAGGRAAVWALPGEAGTAGFGTSGTEASGVGTSAPAVARAVPRARPPVVRLAGPPLGRSGAAEVWAALAALPEVRLEVRRGAVVEPAALAAHPQVRWLDGAAEDLAGVAVLVAPAWAECRPPELAAAARLGVPVVLTEAAAGWYAGGARVQPGDGSGLVAALRAALAGDGVSLGAPEPINPLEAGDRRRAGRQA